VKSYDAFYYSQLKVLGKARLFNDSFQSVTKLWFSKLLCGGPLIVTKMDEDRKK